MGCWGRWRFEGFHHETLRALGHTPSRCFARHRRRDRCPLTTMQRVTIIGAGTIGPSLALIFALYGYRVTRLCPHAGREALDSAKVDRA